jgi:excisionase family DNA binding protein
LEDYFTISQVANRVHKSEQSVVRWIKDGKLACIQISERRRLVAESDFQDFLNSRRIARPPKRIDKSDAYIASSPKRSLTTSGERKAEMDVKSLRKEIARLCQSN